MDTAAALITAFYNLLDETTLRGIMGLGAGDPFRLSIDWAPTDTDGNPWPCPYIVHRVEFRPDSEAFGLVRGTYLVDLFDGPDAGGTAPSYQRILDMRRRVIELLDRQQIAAPSGEFGDCRCYLDTDTSVPEGTAGEHHWAMIFSLRLFRTAEVASITA